MQKAKSMFKKAGVVVAACSAFAASQVHAVIDTATVGTALTGAQTSGEAVGALVIGVVASLAVVGVIIALVRKV